MDNDRLNRAIESYRKAGHELIDVLEDAGMEIDPNVIKVFAELRELGLLKDYRRKGLLS